MSVPAEETIDTEGEEEMTGIDVEEDPHALDEENDEGEPERQGQSEPQRVEPTKEDLKLLISQKSTQVELKKPVKTQSKYWEKFLRIYLNTNETCFVSCKDCKKLLKQDRTTGTSVLKNHKCNTSSGEQKCITQFMKKTLPQKVKAEMADKIAIWCADSFRPFSLVDDPGFHVVARQLVQLGHKYGPSLEMKDILPVATTVSRHIDTTFSAISMATKIHLKLVNTYYCLF